MKQEAQTEAAVVLGPDQVRQEIEIISIPFSPGQTLLSDIFSSAVHCICTGAVLTLTIQRSNIFEVNLVTMSNVNQFAD